MSENTVIQKKDDFIMLPTSDFCFKELMQNSKVRKGIISALLGISPEEIAGTKLLPTSTTEEYPDGKLGILDVLIKLENGTQVGMENAGRILRRWQKKMNISMKHTNS